MTVVEVPRKLQLYITSLAACVNTLVAIYRWVTKAASGVDPTNMSSLTLRFPENLNITSTRDKLSRMC